MYTQCPQCATVFRINAGQLAQARGQVRCGVCEHGFNALESLSELLERFLQSAGGTTAPGAVDASTPTADMAHHPTEQATERHEREETAAAPSGAAATASGPSFYENLADFMAHGHAAAPDTPQKSGDAPSSVQAAASHDHGEPPTPPPAAAPAHGLREIKPFSADQHGRITSAPWTTADHTAANTRREPTVSGLDNDLLRDETADLAPISIEPRPAAALPVAAENGGGWRIAAWALANIALIAVLLGQYAYFNREELTQYPDLRPGLTQFCNVLGCDVPLLKDPSRISLANRVVQSHPGYEHALLIDATLVNEAAFTQAYPELELRFSDLDNRLVAGRRFRPAEYLPPGTDIPKGMTPRQPVRFSLEIADPGKQAVSFQFNLL